MDNLLSRIPDDCKIDVARLYNQVQHLTEEINSLRRKLFGRKCERYVVGDYIPFKGSLFDEPESLVPQEEQKKLNNENNDENQTTTKKDDSAEKSEKKKDTSLKPKKALPENLPREVRIHDLPEEQKKCPHDGTQLEEICEDVFEKLTVVPASLKIVEHRYKKYSCPCCHKHIVKPKSQPSILSGSLAEPELIAHVAAQKFLFALPLYRQEELFKQKNIEIPRSTLARWMIAAGQACFPLVEYMKQKILENPVVHCDETPVQVLKGTGKNPTAKTYMWVLANSIEQTPAVVFQYYTSRSQISANHFLGNFKGFLQVDGYAGYNAFCSSPFVTRVGCFAHVRRKFESAYVEGAKQNQSISGIILEKIKILFLIERECSSFSAEDRIKMRQEKSKPIVDEIKNLIDTNILLVPEQSKIGKALHYAYNECPHLLHFLNNGFISLSNNLVENAIRPFAIGKKNWLFSNSADGAHASANLFSLIESAKLHDLDPVKYLTHVFKELPNCKTLADYEALLPYAVCDEKLKISR